MFMYRCVLVLSGRLSRYCNDFSFQILDFLLYVAFCFSFRTVTLNIKMEFGVLSLLHCDAVCVCHRNVENGMY